MGKAETDSSVEYIDQEERDLKGLRIRAAEDNNPCQTLVTMVLHKYVTGRLVEK